MFRNNKLFLLFLFFGIGLGGIITYFLYSRITLHEKPGLYWTILDDPSDWETFDEEGIVMHNYKNIPRPGKYYTPVNIARYALANYNHYVKTGKSLYRVEFLKHADWLANNQIITPKDFGVWDYEFNYPAYKCQSPWISAMAQGQAISVLTRAYQLTGDINYLRTANLAIGSFKYSVDEGGVRFIDTDKNVFYLEYPCDLDLPPRVLNGFIFSLLGLYDHYQFTGNLESLKLFNEGIRTLKLKAKDYDTDNWTNYDLLGRKASEKYHKLHCRLLFNLYFITGDRDLLSLAEKWYSYLK